MLSLSSFSKNLRFRVLVAGLLALAGFAFLRPQFNQNVMAASGPTMVFLSQPAQVWVGETMVVKLMANNAKDLAGFQATISFDSAIVHLTSANLSADLSRTGRGLLTLGPIVGYDTVTLGAATCPVLVCENLAEARVAHRQTQGVSGWVELATLEVFIVAPGMHQLTLSEVQLVAPDGALLDALTTATLVFTVNQ